MINPVNTTLSAKNWSLNRGFTGSPEDNTPVKTSIFYVNDFHGKATNMERAITASKAFDHFVSSKDTDTLKLASGDIMLGEDTKINTVAKKFLKFIGVTASAVGNHECDMKSADFKEVLADVDYNLLACNLKTKNPNPLSEKVKSSIVEEHNGHKYGIIGTLPSDLLSRVKYGKVLQDQEILPANINETIQDVQKEVDKLKSQGVNKIILLSHSGYGYDRKIAQNTDGLDVILGGHSHNLVEGVTDGENLLSSKSGEPVVITQAGRDGKNFGVLNLEFNSNGIIVKVQNNVGLTRKFCRFAPAKHVFDGILGKSEVVGVVNTAPPILKNDLIDPNPLANFALDAIREKTGADIAMVCAANLRGYLEKGKVDTMAISEISPFKNKLMNIEYTEKEIVDALKFGAKSLNSRNNKPGIIYVSGMKYEISKDGHIYNLKFIHKDGTEEPIDIHNPRADKKYLVTINDYYASGNDDFAMLNKSSQAVQKFDFDMNYCIEQYFRNHKEPVDIVDDGRIKIID